MNDKDQRLDEIDRKSGWDEHRLQIILAIIGAGATVMAAIIAGVFTVIPANRGEAPAPPTPVPTQAVTFTVEIDGPAEAPLGKDTYFTIVSEDATRIEWAIAGFGSGEIAPFDKADQVFVTPNDPSRVDEWFLLVVTAYNGDGESTSTRHRFQLKPAEE